MWLIIGSTADVAVLWVYEGLLRNGLTPVYFVPIESLGLGNRWEHRLTGSENTTKLALADGRTIDSRLVRGTVNRVLSPAFIEYGSIVEGDRGYVCQETFSLYVSWLKSLPEPILNAPDPQGLCGNWRHISEWVWLASCAGLPVPSYRLSSDEIINSNPKVNKANGQEVMKTAIVVRDRVFGDDLPPNLVNGCIQLAKLARLETVGIDFSHDENNGWTFVSASPMPDFRLGGWPLMQKLITILTAEDGGL